MLPARAAASPLTFLVMIPKWPPERFVTSFDLLLATPLEPDPSALDRICPPPARPASVR